MGLSSRIQDHVKVYAANSPELNRIETLWRLLKHRRMALTRRTKEEQDHVLANFGGQFKMEC